MRHHAFRSFFVVVAAAAVGAFVPGAAQAQVHHHGGEADGDPMVRVMMESPQLVLAHFGYLGLSRRQMEVLRASRDGLCAAQSQRTMTVEAAQRELAALIAAHHIDEDRVRAVVRRMGEAEAEWVLAQLRAREEVHAVLIGEQHRLVTDLAAHWERELGIMLREAHGGHAGHGDGPGVRVPGMTVNDMTITPYCRELHGPLRHYVPMPPSS